MTNEKTIEIMQNMKNHAERTDDKELMDACDTAIKSLETLRDITVLFDQWTSGELNDGQYHFQMQNLILFGKKLAEVQNETVL